MTGRVGRLRLRCTARRAGAARAMRMRTRLEGTARHHLPSALDPALACERRVYVDRLAVRLDFALDDYDDVTVAALWAARVRSALERALREGDPAVRSFESEDEFVAAAAVELAERGELSWVFEELGCGKGRVAVLDFLFAFESRRRVAALARALSSRPGLARALHRRLEPGEREIAVAALRGRRRWGDRSRPAVDSAPTPHRDLPADEPAATDRSIEIAERGEGVPSLDGARAGAQSRPAAGVEAWLEALAECARSDAADVVVDGAPRARTARPSDGARREMAAADGELPSAARGGYRDGDVAGSEKPSPTAPSRERPAAEDARGLAGGQIATRFAGLAFVYPWLGGYLDRELPAAPAPPGLDPRIAARLWALARLVAPEAGGAAVGDPLVWLLAGGSPSASAAVPPPPEEELAKLDRPAAELLATFAGLLPGFEGSTPRFVRDRILSRDGALRESDRDGEVLLTLEPDALDAVLGRLPYPRGPFRLAWTPVVQVEVGR